MRHAMPFVVGVMLITLMGCTIRITKKIINELQPVDLYLLYEVKPTNLIAASKCPFSPIINIVNIEAKEDDYNIVGSLVINPKEVTNAIVKYLKYGFAKSQIIIDDNSPRIIRISFNYAKITTGFISYDANIKIKVDVPEINYSTTYEATERAYSRGGPERSMAYAAHLVTRKIIDDPLIQNYILCIVDS